MPTSLATALLLFALVLAIAGGGLLAAALVGGAGVVWEAFVAFSTASTP